MKLYITNRCLCLTGQQVNELGYVDLSVVQPFNETGFLGSTNLTALMFIRSTFQCSKGLCLPSPPFLFAILIHRLELPWAILFPLRLKLRLGAEYKRKLLIYKCLYTIALRQAASLLTLYGKLFTSVHPCFDIIRRTVDQNITPQ